MGQGGENILVLVGHIFRDFFGLLRIFRDFFGLFWIFRDFSKENCLDPNTHIFKSKDKYAKMEQLVPKWKDSHFDIGPILLNSGFQKSNIPKKKGHNFVKIYSRYYSLFRILQLWRLCIILEYLPPSVWVGPHTIFVRKLKKGKTATNQRRTNMVSELRGGGNCRTN